MSLDVSRVFADFLAGNQGPSAADPSARVRPDYGVVATLTGGVLHVTLTFRAGAAYCCFESGCHLGLLPGERWDGLRRRLTAAGAGGLPGRLELRLTGVVEDGALGFDFRRPLPHRGLYQLALVAGYRYDATRLEAEPPG